MHIIKVENVNKTYKNGTKALHNFSLSVEQGALFTLLGPNGAGKSTLMNILTTGSRFNSGTIEILGKSLEQNSKEICRKTAYVSQNHACEPHLTVFENLNYQLCLYGIKKKDRLEKISEMLELFMLTEVVKSPAGKLSGGTKRKLDIAMNLILDPEILFLDEPALGLDLNARSKLWDILLKINEQGTTILMSSHDLTEAESLSTGLCIIAKGQNRAQGSPQVLRNQFGMTLKELYMHLTQPQGGDTNGI